MTKEKAVETQEQPTLVDFLAKLPDAPTKETIDQWKAEHGEVFVSGFSESELFIFRPLLRSEHRKMQLAAQDQQNPVDQLAYEEMVCDLVVLYPKENNWEKKAGVASTLFEQVMQNSAFFSPSAASMMVMKL